MAVQKIDYKSLLEKAKTRVATRLGNLPLNTNYNPTTNYANLYSGLNKKPIDYSFDYGKQNIATPFNISKDKYSTIPSDYSFTEGTPSELTRFSNLPESVGYGQYTQEPGKSGELFKSERLYNKFKNAYLLGGLPSSTFQIDHIIPLWAGGTDNADNKHILSNNDHNKKTKVGAVARTLYYGKKVGLNEARIIAMNWRDKDTTGIEINENGSLVGSIDVAESKVDEWSKPKKQSFMELMKSAAGETSASIKKLTSLGDHPSYMGEFLDSFTGGVTGGWVQPKDVEYGPETAEWEKKVVKGVEFAGSLTGTIASFIGLKGALGLAGKATGLSKVINANPLATKLANIAPRFTGDKIRVSEQAAAKVLDSMGLFGVHGQLSRQEQNTLKERTVRLATDLTMGGMLGAAGQNVKSYVSIGTGTLMLSTFQGADLEDSAVNALTIMALHGMGYKSKKTSKENIEKMATDAALKHRQSLLGNKVSLKLPKDNRFSLESISKDNTKIAATLQEKVRSGEMSIPQAQEEMYKTILSGRQLYKGGLGVKAKAREELKDLTSVFQTIEKGTVNPSRNPSNAIEYYSKNPDIINPTITKTVKPIERSEFSGNMPTGEIPLTGIAERLAPETAKNIRMVDDLIKLNKTDRKIQIVRREDYEGIIKGVNEKMTQKQIDTKLNKIYENPEKNLAAIKIIDGKIYDLGMIPRAERIDGLPNSINENIRKINAEKGTTYPTYDPAKINKNTVYDAMKNNNMQVMEADISLIGKNALKSGEPFMNVQLKDSAWLEGVARNEGLTGINEVQAKRMLGVMREQQKVLTPSEQIERLPIHEGEGSVLMNGLKNEVANVLKAFENANRTPAEYKKVIEKYFGKDTVTETDLQTLLTGKESVTLKDIMKILKNVPENNSTATAVQALASQSAGHAFMLEGINNTPIRSKTQAKVPVETKKVPIVKKEVQKAKEVTKIVEKIIEQDKGQAELPLPKNLVKVIKDAQVRKRRTLTEKEIREEEARQEIREGRVDAETAKAEEALQISEDKMGVKAVELTNKSFKDKLSKKEYKELDDIGNYFEDKYRNPFSPIVVETKSGKKALTRDSASALLQKLKTEDYTKNKKTIDSLTDQLYGDIPSKNVKFEPMITEKGLSTKNVKNAKLKVFWDTLKTNLNLGKEMPVKSEGILEGIMKSQKSKAKPRSAKILLEAATGREYNLTDKEINMINLIELSRNGTVNLSKLPKGLSDKVKFLKKKFPDVRIYAAPGKYTDIENILNRKKLGAFNMFPYVREHVKSSELYKVLADNGITKNKLSKTELKEVTEFLRSGEIDYVKSEKIKPILENYYETRREVGSGSVIEYTDPVSGETKTINLSKRETLAKKTDEADSGMTRKTESEITEKPYTLLEIYESIIERPDTGLKDAKKAAEDLSEAIRAISSVRGKSR